MVIPTPLMQVMEFVAMGSSYVWTIISTMDIGIIVVTKIATIPRIIVLWTFVGVRKLVHLRSLTRLRVGVVDVTVVAREWNG